MRFRALAAVIQKTMASLLLEWQNQRSLHSTSLTGAERCLQPRYRSLLVWATYIPTQQLFQRVQNPQHQRSDLMSKKQHPLSGFGALSEHSLCPIRGLYTDDGKENGNYHRILGYIVGFAKLGLLSSSRQSLMVA